MNTDPNAFTIDAMLCDSAALADNKLFTQGAGWSTISSPAMPFTQPRIGVGLVMGVPYTATNQPHKLEIVLLNQDGGVGLDGQPLGEDGGPTALAVAEFALGRPPLLAPGERQWQPFAMNFDGLRFVAPGAYHFSIRLDGDELNRLEFRVALIGPLSIAR